MEGTSRAQADWALVGGLVHREAAGEAERLAVAIGDGHVVFVGGEQELLTRYGSRVAVRRLAGQHVYPGFADAHGHLYHLGARLEEVRLEDTHSLAEAQARVRAAAGSLTPSAWVLGGGWDESRWEGGRPPTAEQLDEACGGRPAFLLRRDCHAAWVSSAALALAGIDASFADPDGGRVLRDERGKPSGILVDHAMDIAERRIPPPELSAVRRRVLAAARACARAGLTSVHDMGADQATLQALRSLDKDGSLPIRVYAALRDQPALWEEEFARGPEKPAAGRRLAVRAVKLFADGALGSRGAALFDDYADEPGHRGLALLEGEELVDRLTRATRAGYQCCVHAIGDRANRAVLDAFAALARGADGPSLLGLRPRIEHAQVLAEPDIGRFAAVGVIASMQPVHAASDAHWAEARLGRGRSRYAYAWNSLAKARARLCFGSDFPVESFDPREGLVAARTRAPLEGSAGEAWVPEEQVSASVALAAYTSGAAYASFAENEQGRIAEGYAADFTIWDRDLSETAPADLRQARVVATVVGGRVEYLAGGAA